MYNRSQSSCNATADRRQPPTPQQLAAAGKTTPNRRRPDAAVAAGTNASPPDNSERGTTQKQNMDTRSSMDFLESACKKSAKTAVKLGKIMFKTLLRPIVRTTSRLIVPTCLQSSTARHKLHDFMTLIIKVDSGRPGWQKGVLVVLKKCEGARFKMDQNGVVEISGLVGDPKKLLKKLGRSNRINLLWFQFGQCSENLFMASSGKKTDPPAKENKPPIGHGNSTRFPFFPHMHAGFANGYHPNPNPNPNPNPHLITPYPERMLHASY